MNYKEKLKTIIDGIPESKIKKLISELNENKPLTFEDIKTYEIALNVLEPCEDDIIYPTDVKSIIATKKLKHIYRIINHLNNDWKPDWLNEKQYKYYPWFNAVPNCDKSENGKLVFVCSNAHCRYGLWAAFVGSRLCTYNSEVAEYIGKQFKDIYNDYLK